MAYSISQESVRASHIELEPLYREHYAEMSERLKQDGFEVSPFNPRVEEYYKAGDSGTLLTFVLRHDGWAVGYCNVYVTNDMHNHDLIAQEDTIFVTKKHRIGVGRLFVKYMLAEMKKRGVKRVTVAALTDLRVANLWRRMGFKDQAIQMVYTF